MRIRDNPLNRQGSRRHARRYTRLLFDESGNTLIETALSLVLLMSCMVSLISFSKMIFAKHYVASAARLGTRYAIVRGSTSAGASCSTQPFNCQATAGDISNYVLSTVPPWLSPSAMTVQVNWPGLATSGLSCITVTGSNSPGCVVQVIVGYQLGFNLPVFSSGLSSFQSASTMMIEQ